MKIYGYSSEFQQMRKAAQKDDAQLRENAEKSEQATENAGGSKAVSVSISAEARRKGKLRMASDFREAKVTDVKERLNAGTLVNEESLKSGTRKMLNSLFSGEF